MLFALLLLQVFRLQYVFPLFIMTWLNCRKVFRCFYRIDTKNITFFWFCFLVGMSYFQRLFVLLTLEVCLIPTRQNYVPMTSWERLQKMSYGRPQMVSMQSQGTSPTTVLRTSSTDVLGTLKYGVLRTSLGVTYCPICNPMGRLLPMSWERLLQTLWGRPHTV